MKFSSPVVSGAQSPPNSQRWAGSDGVTTPKKDGGPSAAAKIVRSLLRADNLERRAIVAALIGCVLNPTPDMQVSIFVDTGADTMSSAANGYLN